MAPALSGDLGFLNCITLPDISGAFFVVFDNESAGTAVYWDGGRMGRP